MDYRLRLLFSVVLIVAAVLAVGNFETIQGQLVLQLSELSLVVSSTVGIAAVSAGIVLLIPNSLLFLMTGAVFGLRLGFLLNLLGFILGSLAAFLVARFLANDYIHLHAHDKLKALSKNVSQEGWKSVALLRIFPIIPTFLVNYLLGATEVRIRDFIWASGLFIVPSCFVFTYIGAVGREILTESGTNPERILTMVGFVLALIIFSVIVNNRRKAKRSQN